jgi:hypothetical protein
MLWSTSNVRAVSARVDVSRSGLIYSLPFMLAFMTEAS